MARAGACIYQSNHPDGTVPLIQPHGIAAAGTRVWVTNTAGKLSHRAPRVVWSPVYPGDTITVEGWADGPAVYFRTRANGSVVIDHGTLRRLT